MSAWPWYRDRQALRLIGFGYLPWLVALNLVWEIAQLPLYALWYEAPLSRIAIAVAHCTAGDALIGTSALALALVVTRAADPVHWNWARIVALTGIGAVAYTVLSEWMNVVLLQNWAYAASMPILDLGGFRIGLSPILQWVLLPPLALALAGARVQHRMPNRPVPGEQI